MNLIEINTVKKTKVDQVELIISIICLVNTIKLSKTDKLILAYYVVYGVKNSTDNLIVKSGVCSNIGTLRNLKTKLKRKGFLYRTDMYKSFELNISKKFVLTDSMRVLVKIDKSFEN